VWDWCEFWWYEFSTAAQDWGGSWRVVWSTTSCPGGGKRITLWIWRTDQLFDVYEAAPSAAEVDRLKPEALEPLRRWVRARPDLARRPPAERLLDWVLDAVGRAELEQVLATLKRLRSRRGPSGGRTPTRWRKRPL
jgi:hypothetical protein